MTLTPEEIKALRIRLSISTEKLGFLLGVSGRTVRNWEKGATRPPHRHAVAMQQMGDRFLERVYDYFPMDGLCTMGMTVVVSPNGVHQL